MCGKASANTAFFCAIPATWMPIRQLCSHFRNCQVQKTHEIGGGIGNAERGHKTRIEVPPAMLRPHQRTTVPIERTESRFGRDGAGGQL
ncbi:unnamed protein product [Lasius platythorax]|uniref:Secreted protein n=1 Tax=Lasius platythorax TaxID=488582 RepID=A0AAV2P507_9HYME